MSGKLAEHMVVVTLSERVSDDAFGRPVPYPAGSSGTIVSVHAGDGYTVEVRDERGHTLALVDYTGEELLALPTADAASQRFVDGAEWRFAKTMAHYNPHWYVVERDAGGERSPRSWTSSVLGRCAAIAVAATSA